MTFYFTRDLGHVLLRENIINITIYSSDDETRYFYYIFHQPRDKDAE